MSTTASWLGKAPFAVLAALALAPAPAKAAADRAAAVPARFPARLPPAAARAAGMTAAGLAVAALVLFGLVVAGASAPPPAATGTGLKTATIGGTTVLTNAKGFTLYSFAPGTPATSKCYGSCPAYWPPVTGTPRPGRACRAGSARSSESTALSSSPTTGTRCTPRSATPLPARPGATTSTSTAGSGTKCLPPGKGTATEVTSPGTSRARPGPAKENPDGPTAHHAARRPGRLVFAVAENGPTGGPKAGRGPWPSYTSGHSPRQCHDRHHHLCIDGRLGSTGENRGR